MDYRHYLKADCSAALQDKPDSRLEPGEIPEKFEHRWINVQEEIFASIKRSLHLPDIRALFHVCLGVFNSMCKQTFS
jgi:hypothetical protein